MIEEYSRVLLHNLKLAVRENEGKRIVRTGSNPVSEEDISIIINAIRAIEVDLAATEIDWEISCQLQNKIMQGNGDTQMLRIKDIIEEILSPISIIVVGQHNFNRDFLTYILPFACRNPKLNVMSQEDFLNYMYDFSDWHPYRRNDQRIENHPGLKFLASIGFEWPEIVWRNPSSSDQTPGHISNWSTKSRLKSQFGYSASANISVQARREALASAIYVMGLEEVATFLINHLINNYQNVSSHQDAVPRRQEDAEWLKATFYDSSYHRFIWPG